MQKKRISDPTNLKHATSQSINGYEPLVSRLDFLTQTTRLSSISCSVPAKGSDLVLSLEAPLMTRLPFDASMTPVVREQFLSELKDFGFAWVGNRPTQNQDSLRRIAPLKIDEPIDFDALENASAVELQLYGQAFCSLPSSRLAKWSPSLPIEIFRFEQLAKKVDCLRMLTHGNCVIGAAVSPGAVYDDVRFIVDSGFDYLTLLVDVQFELSVSGNRNLAELEQTIELARKAVSDAGAKAKILVSANLCSAVEMFRCLQSGVTAVTIDGYLARQKPIETTPTKDSYSSILSYAAPTASSFGWVKNAVTRLILELEDCRTYAGAF